MKKAITDISNYKCGATLFFGVIMAVVITIGQISSYRTPDKAQNQEQLDSTDDSSNNDILLLKAADAIATSVQVSLTHQYYFISEIIFAEEPGTSEWHTTTPVLTTYMHTIFRQIISPNAP